MSGDFEALKVFETKVFLLSDEIVYDGSQIKPLWGYSAHGIQGDSVIIFVGPLRVHKDQMVDLKDVRREGHLGEVLISSDKALNLVIEHFDEPPSLKQMYLRLRILSTVVKEVIYEKTGKTIHRDGSDLYYDGRKLSVGVATISLTSGKIHFAMNVISKGAPSYVTISSLADLGIPESDIREFGKEIATRYAVEMMEIASDVSKTRVNMH